MLVQSEDSESAQESLLRFKLLSIFLAPFSIFPYVLGGNNLGQGGPGLVFIFLILVAAIPLTWCLLFLVVSTVVNIYVQLFSNFSLTRNEIFLNFSEWMTAVVFIAVVLGTETLILKLSMVLYLALILLIQAHYLYILYKWFEYSSDLSYKYWLLKGLIFIFYLVVVVVLSTAISHILVKYADDLYLAGLNYILFLILYSILVIYLYLR